MCCPDEEKKKKLTIDRMKKLLENGTVLLIKKGRKLIEEKK